MNFSEALKTLTGHCVKKNPVMFSHDGVLYIEPGDVLLSHAETAN